MESTADLLEKYQRQPFFKGLHPFGPTVRALTTEFANVVAKQDGRQRWVICDKTTGEPALFSHAGVFAQGDEIETGNYVPYNEAIPAGIEEKNVQRRANTRCFYTYVLDSFTDLSMYEGQWALDEYMSSKVKGFNPAILPRRAYLSGQDARYRTRFWMQTPMFLRAASQEGLATAPSHLHPWVTQAARESRFFKANPDRPRVWMKEGLSIVPIGERTPPCLQRGDVVAVSFSVTYHLTSVNWFPQFHPADVVVLRPGDGDVDPTDYDAPAIGLYSRPPPVVHNDEVGEGAHASGTEAEESVMVELAVAGQPAPMEDIVEGAGGWSPRGVPSGHEQESMEVDVSDADRPQRRLSSDTLESDDEKTQGDASDFEEVRLGRGESSIYEDFVDVEAEEVNQEPAKTVGKPTRSRRSRA